MGNLDPVQPTFEMLRTPIHETSGLTPMAGSPYIVTTDWFFSVLGFNSFRKKLLNEFVEFIIKLDSTGVRPTFALVGGSFISEKIYPKDIDAVVAYVASDNTNFENLKHLAFQKNRLLDVRVVPEDTGGLNLVKICCYYHELYSRNRMKGRTSCILMDVSGLVPDNV